MFRSRATCSPICAGLPSTKSGKYKLGKAWIKDMPGVLAWFNKALSTTLFPTLSALFPELLPDASTLRAHSVAVLKYNASHPRTDVHVDDGVLAMTLALSPRANYSGGGTCHAALPPFIGTLFLGSWPGSSPDSWAEP